jgi:hypothetical protein
MRSIFDVLEAYIVADEYLESIEYLLHVVGTAHSYIITEDRITTTRMVRFA